MSVSIPDEAVEPVKALLHGRVIDLRVLVREDRVVLHGRATSYYAKQMAQHLVMKTLGIAALVNEIEVRRVPPASCDDGP